MSLLNVRRGSNRTLLLVAVVVIVALFLYFGGASQLALTKGGSGTMNFGGSTPFGGGWLPLVVALGIGFLLGWTVARRR